MEQISTYVLLYGDFPELARRCLGRLVRSLCEAKSAGLCPVDRLHIGLNHVSEQTQREAQWAVNRMTGAVPVTWYRPERNVGKYPLMRRMFCNWQHPPAKYTMWFDDDSYLDHEMTPKSAADWWQQILDRLPTTTILGQIWHLAVQGRQWDWMQTQPWFNPAVGPPPRNRICFCQGSWWAAHSDFLRRVDWPIPELFHNGGDSLLCEVVRHQGGHLLAYAEGVRINADEAGNHSRAVRRGISQPVVGRNYAGTPLPTDHQHFELEIWDQ